MNPTDIFHGHHPDERGRNATVRVNVSIPRTRCQALEYAVVTSEESTSFRPCEHPPFARVAATDRETTLCWRHLCALGDTGELKVTPWTGFDQLAAEREAVGHPIVQRPEGGRT